ncbi:MAG: hypothetical protein ACI8X5_002793 [Planctomycetota bacterium]
MRMNSAVHSRVLLALGLAISVAIGHGCGYATIAAADSVDQGGTSPDDPPSLSLFTMSDVHNSPIVFNLTMTDAEGDPAQVVFEFKLTDGSDAHPMSQLSFSDQKVEGNAIQLQTSDSGVSQEVSWDFAADENLFEAGASFEEDVRLIVSVVGGLIIKGSGANEEPINVGNNPPQIVDPTIDDSEELSGGISIEFDVVDSSSDPVQLFVQYKTVGSEDWLDPSLQGATTDLCSDPLGGSCLVDRHEVTWLSGADEDLSGYDGMVELRLRAEDGYEAETDPKVWAVLKAPFHLDNNELPIALLDADALFLSPDRARGVPITIKLQDAESDPVRLVVQWRRAGEAFPEFDFESTAELAEAIANPNDRAALHICTEQPTVFEGIIGKLPGSSESVRQLRLPELASSASSLASQGLAGRSVEIFRASQVLDPVNWDLKGVEIKDVIPLGDGTRALVLARVDNVDWVVGELDLENPGANPEFAIELTEGQLAGFVPVAIATDPDEEFLFIALFTEDKCRLIRIERDSLERSDISSNLIEVGGFQVRDLAAPSYNMAIITTSDQPYAWNDSLVLLDKVDDPALGGAWGVAADPLDPNQAYISNPSKNQIYSLDLATGVPKPLIPEGSSPISSPRSLAIESNGERLLVVTQEESSEASIFAVNVRRDQGLSTGGKSKTELSIVQLAAGLPDPEAQLATGPDGLRILTSSELLVGGGLEQTRAIDISPNAYDTGSQVILLSEDLSPAPSDGSPWLIRAEQALASSSTQGQQAVFFWDVSDVPQGGIVFVRALATDNDIGEFAPFEAAKTLRSNFDGAPLLIGNGGATGAAPRNCLVQDVDGDGYRDLLVTQSQGIEVFLQTQPGSLSSTGIPFSAQTDLQPIAIDSADLNDDGFLDLVVANGATNKADIYLSQAADNPGEAFFILVGSLGSSEVGNSAYIEHLAGILVEQREPPFDVYTVTAIDSGLGKLLTFRQSFFNDPEFILENAIDYPLVTPIASHNLGLGPDPDLVVGGWPSQELTIFYNFQTAPAPQQVISIPGLGSPRALQVTDLDRDNLVDILIASELDDQLFLVPQIPLGEKEFIPKFGAPQLIGGSGITENPTDLATADLDGDGDLDLVSANNSGDNLTVFFQDASGKLSPLPLVLGDTSNMNGPSSVIATDINDDGLTDLVSANQFGNNLTVFLQRAHGTLGSTPVQVIVDGPAGLGADPLSIATGDIDGDGILDLVCANKEGGGLSLFLQSQPGIYSPSPFMVGEKGNDSYEELAIADLNGDGHVDIVAGNTYSMTVDIFFLRPNPDYTPLAGDGSGNADLGSGGSQGTVGNLGRLGPGGTPSSPIGIQSIVKLGGPGVCLPRSLAVADFNADGLFDIASAGATTPIFLQPTSGFISTAVPSTDLSTASLHIAAHDVDRDGWMDLTTASENLIVHFQTTTGGGFHGVTAAPTAPSVGSLSPNSITISDVNSDGLIDVTIAERLQSQVRVFLQSSLREFASDPLTLERKNESFGPQQVVAADIDRDGMPELLCANADGNDLTIFFQALPGLFVPEPIVRGGFGTTNGIHSLVAADLDGDGDLDVASVNPGKQGDQGSDSITVFWGGH